MDSGFELMTAIYSRLTRPSSGQHNQRVFWKTLQERRHE